MKLAIITGASAGIGYSTAVKFMADGFRVINVSRRECHLQGVENFCCDMSDIASVEGLATQLIAECEKADQVSLIHNACRMAKDSALECDAEDLQLTLAVNIVAPTILNTHLLEVMPQGSSVIYIGSTLSEKAVASSYSYVSTKHALIGMMRASCQDLVGKAIHTACICPGFTATEMLKTHMGHDDALMLEIGGKNGFGRLIEPEEISELIFWTHHNPVVNGSVLHANLGQIQS